MIQKRRNFIIFCPCSGVNPIRVTQFEYAEYAQCPHCGSYRPIPRGIGQVAREMRKARVQQRKSITA